jgi:hypothetical protein
MGARRAGIARRKFQDRAVEQLLCVSPLAVAHGLLGLAPQGVDDGGARSRGRNWSRNRGAILGACSTAAGGEQRKRRGEQQLTVHRRMVYGTWLGDRARSSSSRSRAI